MANFGKYSKNGTFAYYSLQRAGEVNQEQESLAGQDTVITQTDTFLQPTTNIVQNWKWLGTKKMVVPGSEYLSTIDYAEIMSADTLQPATIELPVYKFNRYNTDWLTLILLLVLVLLATVRVGYAKYISTLFQSIVNYSTAFRMFREKNYSILHGASRLEALYYIVFSVFLFQILALYFFGAEKTGIIFYGKTLAFIVLYFVSKKTIYKALGTIFNGVAETSEILFSLDNFNRVTGIILIPIVALIAFYPYENINFIVLLGGLTVVGSYLFLLQRGISILLKKQFSIFYLFLYLCTLEFLPLLLIYKVIVE